MLIRLCLTVLQACARDLASYFQTLPGVVTTRDRGDQSFEGSSAKRPAGMALKLSAE